MKRVNFILRLWRKSSDQVINAISIIAVVVIVNGLRLIVLNVIEFSAFLCQRCKQKSEPTIIYEAFNRDSSLNISECMCVIIPISLHTRRRQITTTKQEQIDLKIVVHTLTHHRSEREKETKASENATSFEFDRSLTHASSLWLISSSYRLCVPFFVRLHILASIETTVNIEIFSNLFEHKFDIFRFDGSDISLHECFA